MGFELSEVVPWGRSFDEYVAMFALTEGDLRKRILGCGDGPASFNAVASRRGTDVVSADPIYRFSAEQIESRIDETAATIELELRKNEEEFVWEHFLSVDDAIAARRAAMRVFLKDYSVGSRARRYVDASLPDLLFETGRFDLALCSHFLFLYSERHDAEFHVRSLLELLRVASEVRIFPLLELGSRRSRHLTTVISELLSRGYRPESVEVAYQFQRGGNQMLRIPKPQ